MSDVVQCNVMWDRVVSCGSEQSHVGNSNLMWDRVQGVQDRMDRRSVLSFLTLSKSQKPFKIILNLLIFFTTRSKSYKIFRPLRNVQRPYRKLRTVQTIYKAI